MEFVGEDYQGVALAISSRAFGVKTEPSLTVGLLPRWPRRRKLSICATTATDPRAALVLGSTPALDLDLAGKTANQDRSFCQA